MRRFALLAAVFAVLGTGQRLVLAQGHVATAYHAFGREWTLNNQWPAPYIMTDRQAVRAPFAIMIDKGWQIQNTLGDHHFHHETQELTRAGEIQLKWIVTQTPESRRTVFVLRGHNDAATSVRVDTVQQAVAHLVPRGPLPAVVQTNNIPPTSPAEYSDDVNLRAVKARLSPALPASGGSGGGSSSGSSGGK